VHGSAVLKAQAMTRPWWEDARPLGTARLECAMAAAAPGRSLVDGASVDDGAIQRRALQAQGGDDDALGEIFEALRPDVLRLCTRLLGAVDAQDAANEVFQRAQHRLASFDPAQPFRRWLLSIASHHCVDLLRRRSLEKRLFEADGASETGIEERAASDGSALEGVVRAETRAAVQAALDHLPDRYRAPLVLRYFAELRYDEIAEELGVTRTQVASLLFRGKRRLRALLGGAQEGGS
jgi:RNA polymerase sigma-70 factor (ECF subfamily)